MSQRYQSGLETVKRFMQAEQFDSNKHVRYLRVKIWHFDPVRARYLIAINPVIICAATFSSNLVSLLILDLVVATVLCILLGLSIHDDSVTEGEALLQLAL